MANRTEHPVHSLDRSIVDLQGTATFGASSAIASSNLLGMSIVKTNTGIFTVSFDDQWSSVLHSAITLYQATPGDLIIKPVSIDVANATAASRTMVFQTWDISGAAAADPTSGDFVHILVRCRNSGTARKGV